MEHYITEIKIEKLRHLANITIPLNEEQRQHLIVTGKNGSGKTSLLLALQKYLQEINENRAFPLAHAIDGLMLSFNGDEHLEPLYGQGNFITAYFPAGRKTLIVRSHGVEDIKLDAFYDISAEPGQLLHKYMVHLKTQQSYARNEGDMAAVDRIQKWFDRFVGALRVLLDDATIQLEYDYKEYDFKLHETGRIPFGLDALSDGYSSVIQIVSDLMLRMDKNWLLGNEISKYDIEGVVLIDEIETHLHIGLQKKIMPFLTEFFPRIQFIITTHSPYILNSISNAKIYDLENCMELEDLSMYSSDALAEGYFGADEYSDKLKEKITRYQYLKEKESLTEEERAERAKLRYALKNIPRGLSQEAVDLFNDIEGKHL